MTFNYTTEGRLPKGEKPRIQSEFQGASVQNCRSGRSQIASSNTFSQSHVSHQPIICRRILRKKRLTTTLFDSRTPQMIDASTGSNVVYPYHTFKDVIFILELIFQECSWSYGWSDVSKFTHAYNDLSAHAFSRTRQYIVRKKPFGVMTGSRQSRIDTENAC